MEKTLYFIDETKTSKEEIDLRASKRFKIKCSEKSSKDIFENREVKDT